MNLFSGYSSLLRAVRDHDPLGVDVGDLAVVLGEDHVAGVDRGAALHAGADQRRLGLQQRHRLALHVRAHQRAVGVVVLEERDQRGRDRPDLGRRDVHQVDFLGRGGRRTRRSPARTEDLRALQLAGLRVELGVRLGDHLVLLLGRVEVDDLVGDDAVLDHPVRGRDEAVLGDLRRRRRASRSGRCSGPPGSRSGTSGRSGSGARRGPRSGRAHGSDRRRRAPRGGGGGSARRASWSGP